MIKILLVKILTVVAAQSTLSIGVPPPCIINRVLIKIILNCYLYSSKITLIILIILCLCCAAVVFQGQTRKYRQ